MTKYSFDRLPPEEFEAMAQALLEKLYRTSGNLIQFGDGQDGGREATWTQTPEHPEYKKPVNEIHNVSKEWVFQVKYHNICLRGWEVARKAVIEDLEKELDKIVNKHQVPCHAYIMITNVPFTGVRNFGTRDKVKKITQHWKKNIPEIQVWDATDLSRMLDANEDVRTAYLDFILTGDVFKAIINKINLLNDNKKSIFKAYLNFIKEREISARAEEAGDEPNLPLSEVFIDFTLFLKVSDKNKTNFSTEIKNYSPLFRNNCNRIRASNALFFSDDKFILLLGNPGLGKSTLTQFLSLYQATRVISRDLALSLAKRLKLPNGIKAEELDAYVILRFPFRIELRRYAKWMSEQQNKEKSTELARYIVEILINQNTSSSLEMGDIFDLASQDPILLILDGLDEVPNLETRKEIIENLKIFLRRINATEKGNIQVILSSRPKGYSSEFEEFDPIKWELNELEISDFNEYCDQWLKQRIRDVEERREAKERIEYGMKSESVKRLACSLLQATVILTIVQRKIEIPHQRHLLYKKYVEVIFAREKGKSSIVSKWEKELLLLHERVGFELHCKMEHTQIQSLNSNEFRGYVHDVLENCSGTDIGNKIFKDVINEIIDAANNRLCLLVGTGENQKEIDFLVQQYREYFAASYLTNHPDAEPNLIFSTLVKRGAYWAEVLQFYVAQTPANQQLRWLHDIVSINDRSQDKDLCQVIIERTKTCRAILNILPEFDLQRKKDLEFAFKTIFDKQIRWTWLEQESIIDILRIIPSGSEIILKWLDNLSKEDIHILEAELWLLVQASLIEPEKNSIFKDKIQELLTQKNIQHIVLLLCLYNDLMIDLSNCNISEFYLIFENYYYNENIYISKRRRTLDNLVSCQINTKIYELFLCIPLLELTTINFPFLDSNLPKDLQLDVNLSIFQGKVKLKLKNYLYRISDKEYILNRLYIESVEINNKYINYLIYLLKALTNYTDIQLDQKTREIEKKINKNILVDWRSENILGPDITAFNSTEDWQNFKTKLSNMSEYEWISNCGNFDESLGLWIALFFHPNDWPLLVIENLITEKEYQDLLHSPLGDILKIPIVPINLFNGCTTSGDEPIIPLLKILRIALKDKNQIKSLGSERVLSWILHSRKIEPVTNEETEVLLNNISKIHPLPSIWSSMILRLCLDTPSLNLDLLIDFWKINKSSMPNLILYPNEATLDKSNLVEELLNKNQECSLQLAAAITACNILLSKKTQNRLLQLLLDQFVNYLNDEYIFDIFYHACLNLEPNIKEFLLWQRLEIINKISQSPYRLNKLCNRLLIINSEYQLNSKQLRQELSVFITERHNYPLSIVLVALEAILKIDEANLSVLVDKDWQRLSSDD